MPELPEVETVRRGLNKLMIGHIVSSVHSDNPKSFPNAQGQVELFLIGAGVTEIRRRAKLLMIDLSTGYTLVIHLKMTGQLVYRGDTSFGAGHPTESLIGQLPDKSTRVELTFTDSSKLFFNDQRKFGWMRLVPTDEVGQLPFMLKVGPEPLAAGFTAEQFAARFARRSRTSLKAALLDQTVVAGVGNIYADESLWGAKLHPQRLVGGLKPVEFKSLFLALRLVMNLAIAKGGSTDRNYVNAEGKRGSYMDFARVFRREGLECPRCGNEIIKLRVAGRGTHICPHCQRL
ncbi:MAG: bifunctional DNA-formamidopyrimidine glycosylase/DNA-(apurinic or apyrimidinic site) lyase [Candidatus Saccharibacteria bacterium]